MSIISLQLVRSSVYCVWNFDICSVDYTEFLVLYIVNHVVTKSLKQWIFVKVLIFVKEIDVIKKKTITVCEQCKGSCMYVFPSFMIRE